MNAFLLNQRLTDLSFTCNLGNEDKEIHLGIKYDFEVLNSSDNIHSHAKIKYYIEDTDAQPSLKLVVGFEGIIEHDVLHSSDDKIDIHLRSYDMLFPYVQMMVSQTISFAGMPPLMIPKDKLEKDRIGLKENNNS